MKLNANGWSVPLRKKTPEEKVHKNKTEKGIIHWQENIKPWGPLEAKTWHNKQWVWQDLLGDCLSILGTEHQVSDFWIRGSRMNSNQLKIRDQLAWQELSRLFCWMYTRHVWSVSTSEYLEWVFGPLKPMPPLH